jgi:hypothetical protein
VIVAFGFYVQHGVIPKMYKMMRDVDSNIPFNAHSGVMKRHSGFFGSVKSAEGVVLSLGHRLHFLVAIVISGVEAIVGISKAVIEDRMFSGIPAAVAYV